MSRNTGTREKIIDRARDLLHSRGFDGFSYSDISVPLGIRNAAVHYHFPAKSDLGLAMIERFTEEVRLRIEGARANKVPARIQLEAFFSQIESEVCDRDWVVCPMGALVTCFDQLSEQMKQASRRLATTLHQWMTATLEQGRTLGDFRFDGDAADKATEIACAVQGARQMSKVSGKNVVGQVARQIRKDLYC